MLILHTFACETRSLNMIYRTECMDVFQCIMALAFALTSVKFIMYMWESDNTDLTANLVHGLSEVYVEPWVAYIYTAPLGYKPCRL